MDGLDGVFMWTTDGEALIITPFYHPASVFDPEQGLKDIDLELERRHERKETHPN